MSDILIVGAGPAGLTAAIYAQRAGLKSIVFDKNAYGGQMVLSNEVENYPSVKKTDGIELATQMYEHATSLGADIKFEEVSHIELNGKIKKVVTASGDFEGKAVILAGGAARRKLGCPGEEEFAGRGVSYCATCDGAFYRDKVVAIVGGGNTALEDAIFLASNCKKVYLIHRRDEFRGEKILQDAVRSKENVEVLYSTTVQSINGTKTVEKLNLQTKNGEKNIEVNGIFIAVGLVPETSLYKGVLALDENGYIVAGEECSTSMEGVFVAGDIRTKPLRQIVTACGDGAVAAVAAATYCSSANT